MNAGSVLRVRVEKLAPTGEGVVRTNEGVGLVTGVLPGEDVEVEVVRVTSKIWRGRPLALLSRSPARASGDHAGGCPACDWAHVDLAAARAWKRELFLETMRRVGRLPAEAFGDLPIEASPPGYRLRSRLHLQTRERRVVVGAFAPGTHEVVPLEDCEALSAPMRDVLPRIAESLTEEAADAFPMEISTVETLDGSRRLARIGLAGRADAATRVVAGLSGVCDGVSAADSAGRILHREGEERLWLPVGPGGREVPATPDAFFQANRFLVEALALHVRDLAAEAPAGRALDAFGGSGLFAASLLDAGHEVVSVEGSREASRSAREAVARWRAGNAWRVERSPILDFASRDSGRYELVVADPPRAGLGGALARALARRTKSRFVYVSCDPATLARDLAILGAEGFEIRGARLFDLFALTHRVEAVVSLAREAAA